MNMQIKMLIIYALTKTSKTWNQISTLQMNPSKKIIKINWHMISLLKGCLLDHLPILPTIKILKKCQLSNVNKFPLF
jgi:hypothetical protein